MTDEPVKVTGGCLCGEIRFEADVFLNSAYYCHCTQCQKSSGAPAETGVPVDADSLIFTKGAPKYYVSSEIGKRGFCNDCGSRLVWRYNDTSIGHGTNLSVCALDHPEDVRPNAHTFVDCQLPWYQLADELPRLRAEDDVEFLETFPGK